MDDKLRKYIAEADKAIEALKKDKSVDISHLDFQIALGEKLGYDRNDSHYVASEELTSEQMVNLLKDHSFEKPIELAEVIFSESIIPEGVPISLNEEEIKSKGEIWVIHKYDADPFPSNPHAHNKETGHKIHLGTGELFDYKNKPLNASIKEEAFNSITGQSEKHNTACFSSINKKCNKVRWLPHPKGQQNLFAFPVPA